MGETLRTHFSDNFPNDTFGLITGVYATLRFPNTPGRLARVIAAPGNGDVWRIGNHLNTGSFPLPWPLAAGYDTGWFGIDGNLNNYFYSLGSGSYLMYWVQG